MGERARVIAAWGVHLFTASGAVMGALALLATVRGAWPAACGWMLAALAVDSLDGMLARHLEVGRRAPSVDGRRLDDVVDYLNYVIVPAVFLVASGLVHHWGWVVLPVLASAYGFARVDAKTADDFFRGFPSYWNVLALYAWLFQTAPIWNAALLTGLALLVPLPWKYIYPSRLRAWRRTTFVLTALSAACLAAALIAPEWAARARLRELSLLYPAWYLGLSFALGGWARSGGR